MENGRTTAGFNAIKVSLKSFDKNRRDGFPNRKERNKIALASQKIR
jgi:hypothetical protein